jgi:hypothetical protein
MKLKDHQGIFVPRCYGAYTLEFPERVELSEDKLVNVLLVECIRGKRLTQVPSWDTSEQEKANIWERFRKFATR